MHRGQYVFAQIMAHLPLTTFRRCVARYGGEYKVKHFSCLDQFYAMAFAQLTYRESLRDIEACLAAQGRGLYHLGFRSAVARNTLAHANAVRPWRIYADLAQHLIAIARPLYANEPIGLDLTETVYAFDSTTIDLCLSLFPWGPFRSTRAAIKLHTLLDVRGAIPSFMHIGDGRTHEVNALDELLPEPGAFYRLDRGYTDFGRLHALHAAGTFFLSRAKRGLRAKRRYSHPVDRVGTPVLCDQTVVLEVYYSKQGYPRAVAPRRGARRGRPAHRVSDQQHAAATADRRRVVPAALASRTVLQVDQAAPARAGLLRHQRKRGEDPNLHRRGHLRADRHRQEVRRAAA